MFSYDVNKPVARIAGALFLSMILCSGIFGDDKTKYAKATTDDVVRSLEVNAADSANWTSIAKMAPQYVLANSILHEYRLLATIPWDDTGALKQDFFSYRCAQYLNPKEMVSEEAIK